MTVKRTGGQGSVSIHVCTARRKGRYAVGRLLTLEELLFQLGLRDLDLHSLIDLLLVPALVVGIVLDRRGEQGVDESRLAQPGLASDLQEAGCPMVNSLK